jgi:hypothetical protein
LKPFEGYLVYAFAKTELVFDPLNQAPPSASKKAAASTGPLAIRFRLTDGVDASGMTFYAGTGFRTTPYFSPMGAGLEMKTVDDGGYFYKPVTRFDSLESTVEITAVHAGNVGLSVSSLSGSGVWSMDIGDLDVRLLDNQSGHVYSKSGIHSIEITQGKNSFSLFMGSTAILDARLNKILSGMPTALTMERNFPNPFFGETNIRYQIPLNIGRVLKARLDVLSLGGKVVQSIDLGSPTIGSHLVQVDGGSWSPGIYVAKLSVQSDRRTSSLSMKMINGRGGR